MMTNRKLLIAASRQLIAKIAMTNNRNVKMEAIEKLALLHDIIDDVTAYEEKLLADLDVD